MLSDSVRCVHVCVYVFVHVCVVCVCVCVCMFVLCVCVCVCVCVCAIPPAVYTYHHVSSYKGIKRERASIKITCNIIIYIIMLVEEK